MTQDQENVGIPPTRGDEAESAGAVDELEGDVDAEPADSSLTVLDPGNDIGPDQGGAPGDAAGESGISGAG